MLNTVMYDGKVSLLGMCCSTNMLNTVMYDGKVPLWYVPLLGMCCSTNMLNTEMYDGKVSLLGMCCSTNMPNTERKKTYIEVNSPVLNSIKSVLRNVKETVWTVFC